MILVFHGGECCAIKTIHELSYDPDEEQEEVKAIEPRNHDQVAAQVNSQMSFFTGEAPEETALERLDRLIAWCEKKRPNGIIEITLADNQYPCYNQERIWGPLLVEREFVCVNSCFNSNSQNRVYVYHRKKDVE